MVTPEQLEEINYRISLANLGPWETSLDLFNLSIDSETLELVMPEIFKIQNLTELNLSNNNLTSLPDSIGELSNLTRLFATDNEIQNLPGTLGNLGNLESLDFSGNPLSNKSENHLTRITQTIQDVANKYVYALNKLFPNDDERVEIATQIETSDLDPASITSEAVSGDNIIQNTVIKSSKNAIKLFLSKVPVDNGYELSLYGPTVKMLLSQLQDRNIPIEDRNTILLGMTSSLGDCNTPVKEHLMRVKIAELIKSGEKLSEENYLMIERLALIEETGKLKNLLPNEKTEAVNALVSLVYSYNHIVHLAEQSDIHLKFINGKNENLRKDRDLPPISINSELGLKLLNPDLIKEFITLVGTGNNIDIRHELNEEKLKELTNNYLTGLGLQSDTIAVEREKYIQQYPEDMQTFIMEDDKRSDILLSPDIELMKFTAHQEVLRELLKNENTVESIKQKYEDYVKEQQSKIEAFVNQKKAPQNTQTEGQGLSTENAMSDHNNKYHQMVSAQIQPRTEVQRGELGPVQRSQHQTPTDTQPGESHSLPRSPRP
ncbi:leucine-rich repeat domain-containing protein [Chryseobacterium sp. CBSDS_008]|uniref:leucine-rich repeat domain-containing protein n=1 Tax=Chryseobacterium sp. CBSDS_008 TaxID=3415265 RepID=UPI003CFB6E6A